MITITIGLLWDESHISGELIAAHDVMLRLPNGESKTILQTAGKFSAKISRPYSTETMWAIRLAECFTRESAERILRDVHSECPDLKTEILAAGKDWNTLTANVWWPIVSLSTLAESNRVLARLQAILTLNPFGFFTVRIGKSEPATEFALNLNGIEYSVLQFEAVPLVESARVALHEVPIGRGFHWEHKETLEYRGTLRVWQGQGRALTAANSLDLEAYLESTVGSEMRSDLPPAFSQAQAIAARSTVLATANRHHYSDGFDLCNDDHCQCYQGTTREANAVVEPVKLTAGRVLIFRERQGRASTESTRCVDARYAKACGGISERYEACWGEDGPDYFAIRACGDFEVPDLTIEKEAADFIKLPPRAWCNEKIHPYPDPWDKDPLFRWKFVHTRIQLGDLIHEKTGTPTGPIQALHVIRRGKSGRILILDIVGAVGTIRLFGELNIRRALSKSHLPSSYFIIEQDRDHITLIGAGWGHGVGLCQLGASAMAKAGMSVEKILEHYYPGSEVDLTQSPRQ